MQKFYRTHFDKLIKNISWIGIKFLCGLKWSKYCFAESANTGNKSMASKLIKHEIKLLMHQYLTNHLTILHHCVYV